MRSRLLSRRSATAVGVYAAAVLGFAATVVAARELRPREFGLFALVVAATGFFQLLLDSTAEEAAVKYGFRYAERGEWGRLRQLFRAALLLKAAGGAAAGIALLALAPLAGLVFAGDGDALLVPLLVAAALPLLQGPEGVAGAVFIVRSRYDVRGALMALSMALRLAAIAVGVQYGVTETIVALVIAQAAASGVAAAVALRLFAAYPAAPPESLASERRELGRFVAQSALATGLVSARTTLGPLILGVVASPQQVAYFRAAQAQQTGFATLSAPARLVVLTEQTRDFERGRVDLVRALLRRYMIGTLALTAVVLPPLVWLTPQIVDLLYPASYEAAVDPMRLIFAAGAIQLVFGWTKSFPVSIGRLGLRSVAHGAEVAALVPLLVIFAAAWGATGAAAAVLVSSAVFGVLWLALLVRLRGDLARPRASAAAPAPSEAEAIAP